MIYEKEIRVNSTYSVSDTDLANLIDEIENGLSGLIKTSTKRKVFTTFIELVQNINFYTENSTKSTNYCVFRQLKDHSFEIECSNTISLENKNLLFRKLNSLSKMSRQEISDSLYSLMNSGKTAQNIKNGLGVVSVFKNSNKVKFDFQELSSTCFQYTITALIK